MLISTRLVERLRMSMKLQQSESRERAVTLLVILYTGWVLRHCGTLMLGSWKRAIVRRQLDIDLKPGRVPFVVLAYQRTGTVPYLI